MKYEMKILLVESTMRQTGRRYSTVPFRSDNPLIIAV